MTNRLVKDQNCARVQVNTNRFRSRPALTKKDKRKTGLLKDQQRKFCCPMLIAKLIDLAAMKGSSKQVRSLRRLPLKYSPT